MFMSNLKYINELSGVALKLHQMANKNLDIIQGKFFEKHEVHDYYLGILRRQAMLCYDLHQILFDRPNENLTTPYIILRSLMDDFINLLYLQLTDSVEENIVKMNAEEHKNHFDSLKFLSNSQHQAYQGISLGYLTEQQLISLRTEFASKQENHKYFTDVKNFNFKKWLTFKEKTESINGSESVNVSRDLAFYLWKEFSSFVHYSTFSSMYEYNVTIDHWNNVENGLQHVFNSIIMASSKLTSDVGESMVYEASLLKDNHFGILEFKKK